MEIPVTVLRGAEFRCSASIASAGANHAGDFNGRLEAGARTLRLAFGSAPWDPAHPTTVLVCRCFRADYLRQFEDSEFVPGTTITATDLAPDRAPSLELRRDFERPAHIVGRVLRRNRPVHPAMIIAERSTPTYAMADSSGRFALPVPRPVRGKVHLRLKPTPGEGLSGWRVVMDGKTMGTNGEADIPVARPEDVRVDFVHD